MSFFDELKRRNVFRVAIAYAITAWLIAQIAGLAAVSFFAPDWVMKMIITMLVLGAPVALVMAWAYELTPGGLRRESDIAPGQSHAQANASKLDRTITIALLLAVAYFTYDKFVLDPRRDAALLENASRQAQEVIPQASPVAPEQSQADQSPSIAVLPFVNMSEDASNEYFSEGLSEELLNLLVKIPELKVAARTSSFSYKGKDTRIARIGEELSVAHVLEGSVRKSGNQLRITAQLIKADDGFHLWSQTYNRTLDDNFAIQDEIAAAVVAALKVRLLGALPDQQETDPEVYSLYLQGKYFNNLRDKESLEKARAAFERALATDPDYAPAWVGVSRTYRYLARYFSSPEEANALAVEAAETALRLDDSLASAWSNMAYLKRTNDWDWQGARDAIEKAMQLEPQNVDVLGIAAALSGTFGDFDTAWELTRKTTLLDPLKISGLRALGVLLSARGRPDEALEVFDQIAAISPNYGSLDQETGMVYLRSGDPERALREFEKLPVGPHKFFSEAMAYYSLGNEQKAAAQLSNYIDQSRDEYPFSVAIIYAWRRENDAAFEWLDKAYSQHDRMIAGGLGGDGGVWLRNLHDDPRFPAFLEKLGLLEFWTGVLPE